MFSKETSLSLFFHTIVTKTNKQNVLIWYQNIIFYGEVRKDFSAIELQSGGKKKTLAVLLADSNQSACVSPLHKGLVTIQVENTGVIFGEV